MAETKRVNIIFSYFQRGLKNLGKNLSGFNSVLHQNMQQWKESRIQNVVWGNQGKRAADRIRALTHGMRGFRMEMLGIMFFGMGLNRFFKGLIKPAMELTGLFQLWGTVLALLFLPTALQLLDWFLPLFNWLINLSEPMKKTIGYIVLFGIAISTILFLVGMFVLGIGSLIIGWGLLTGVILPALGIFVLLAGAIVGLIALWVNWEDVTWQMKVALAAVAAIISIIAIALGAPFIGIIAAVVAAVIGIMAVIKNWEKIMNFFSELWDTIFNALPEPVQNALRKIGEWLDWLGEKLHPILEGLKRIKRFFGIGGIEIGTTLGDYLGEQQSSKYSKPYGEFSRDDMKSAVEEGMLSALDTVAFKNSGFTSGLIADSEAILRDISGEVK